MNTKDLNEHIKHYLEKDKTHSAIMLTGGWGTGKSYYIQHELTKFLEENKKKCIIVSLYGLKDTSEISKRIYLELRIQPLIKRVTNVTSKIGIKKHAREAMSTIYGAGKTLINGFVNSKIELSVSENDLKKLFESIDLSDKLLIFEDVERSSIDIFALLGYVNNLVEQDGVKVILVANESKMIGYKQAEYSSKNEEELAILYHKVTKNENREIDDETQKYFEVKEKTISDTIVFMGNIVDAVKNIIDGFSDRLFCYKEDDKLQIIISFMKNYNDNLRSFIFACQKTVDIIEGFEINNGDFKDSIFFGNLLFSLKYKSGEKVKWDGNSVMSVELGTVEYPVYKLCYNYILNQKRPKLEDIENAEKAYKELRLYDKEKSSNDNDLRVIFNFHIQKEEDVRNALKSVEQRLDDETDISFYMYQSIAKSLAQLQFILDYDMSKCIDKMKKNLYSKGDKLELMRLLRYIDTFHDDKPRQLFDTWMKEFEIALNGGEKDLFDFDYSVEKLESFIREVYEKDFVYLENKKFAKNFNMELLRELLIHCTSEQLDSIRLMFLHIYKYSNIHETYPEDKENIKILLEMVKELQSYDEYDLIQKQQMRYFELNLTDILSRLLA